VPALTWPEPLPQFGAIRLRPFRSSDLQLVAELAADPCIPLIGTVPASFTEAEGLAYLERQQQRLADGTGWSFAIAELDTDRGVGGAALWRHEGGPATAGYAVAPASRGRGYAKAALEALTGFAWTSPTSTRWIFSSSRRTLALSPLPGAAAIRSWNSFPDTSRSVGGDGT
jgi:RimJ/RimL family protein N-acetyltransferase